MTKILTYLGPQSPMGPAVAGIIASIALMLAALIFMPPAIWVSVKIFGWWFRMWAV